MAWKSRMAFLRTLEDAAGASSQPPPGPSRGIIVPPPEVVQEEDWWTKTDRCVCQIRCYFNYCPCLRRDGICDLQKCGCRRKCARPQFYGARPDMEPDVSAIFDLLEDLGESSAESATVFDASVPQNQQPGAVARMETDSVPSLEPSPRLTPFDQARLLGSGPLAELNLLQRFERMPTVVRDDFMNHSRNLVEAAVRNWERTDQEMNRMPREIWEKNVWCICARCDPGAVPSERACCNNDPLTCITLHPFFRSTITDAAVLLMNMLARNDLIGTRDFGTSNRQFRFYAYRSFITWRHGFLGKGRRIPLPSCAYRFIRSKFPEAPGGQYTYFRNVDEWFRQLRIGPVETVD